MVISAAITRFHSQAGQIPDPDYDTSKSLTVLTAHNEALVATEAFQTKSMPFINPAQLTI